MRKSQITKKKVLAITPPGGATDGGQHVDDKKRYLYFWLSSIRHNDAECQKYYTTGTFEF